MPTEQSNWRKFRKKPIVIEAMRFNLGGTNAQEIHNWMTGVPDKAVTCGSSIHKMVIKTLEGDMIAQRGDWIIKGVNGEFYPIKPDIFEKTYEEVTNE